MNDSQIGQDLKANLHNRFDVEVRDAKTGELKQKAVGYNIILNQFWTRLFANQEVYGYIQYGGGSGTPAATDTALFSYIGGAGASNLVYDDAHYAQGWNSMTRSIVLNEQIAVGETITEVGLAGAASGSVLCTHAMLQDMNGNPITITKTDTDIITIYATVFIHWNVNGYNGAYYVPRGHWFGTKPYTQTGSIVFYIDKAMAPRAAQLDQYVYGGTLPEGDASTKTWSFSIQRLAADRCNGSYGLGYYAANSNFIQIDVRGNYQITNESVGTGDGSSTIFDLDFDDPFDITIYFDGVEQSSGYSLEYSDVIKAVYDRLDQLSTDQVHVPSVFGVEDCIVYIYDYQESPDLYMAPYNATSNHSTQYGISYSDDLITWSDAYGPIYPSRALPNSFVGHKYIKLVATAIPSGNHIYASVGRYLKNRIRFDVAPASGTVITASYKTKYVPKDENHVYDLSVSITLGEYSGS